MTGEDGLWVVAGLWLALLAACLPVYVTEWRAVRRQRRWERHCADALAVADTETDWSLWQQELRR